MDKIQIEITQVLFYVSILVATICNVLIFIWWWKNKQSKLIKLMNGPFSLQQNSLLAVFYSIPMILFMILCFVPSFYFGNHLKQFELCKNYIKSYQHSSLEFDSSHPEFVEKCDCFVLDDLQEAAQKQNGN